MKEFSHFLGFNLIFLPLILRSDPMEWFQVEKMEYICLLLDFVDCAWDTGEYQGENTVAFPENQIIGRIGVQHEQNSISPAWFIPFFDDLFSFTHGVGPE
jgi:hypothetical protein